MSELTPAITRDQYVSAIEALGLDPDMVTSITLSGSWIHYSEVVTADGGMPVFDLGVPVLRHFAGPVVSSEEGS